MPTQIVVAGALICDSKVLVAQRVRPPQLAGRWELPGGKVGPGETERDALARELAEELGLAVGDVAVGDRLGDDIAVDVIRDHNHVELRAKLAADAPAADTLPDDLDSWFQFDDPHGAFEQLRKQMHELEEHAKSSMPHGERT